VRRKRRGRGYKDFSGGLESVSDLDGHVRVDS
jgi:hypothetical protein